MFEKKQIIYSETQGVCQVENIVSLSASRRERKIPYYVLRPVFDKSRVSYIPVENHQVKLRELFTREEAEALQGTVNIGHQRGGQDEGEQAAQRIADHFADGGLGYAQVAGAERLKDSVGVERPRPAFHA